MIELMVSVAMLVLLLAVAIPSFEGLAYGSGANRKVLELIGELELARMKAIRTNQPVTVTFNAPAANQYTVVWTDGVVHTKEIALDPKRGRLAFENIPPGGADAPDPSFVFTSQGFIQPVLGNLTGNIYLVDQENGKRFGISTTVAGAIIERRWNGTTWSGPIFSYTP